jgi:hypothetical protein
MLTLLILATASVYLTGTSAAKAKYSGGEGDSNNPYLLSTAEDLNALGENSADWSKCFKLIADIDMSAYTGTQYKIIGNSTTSFTGTFDGDEHIIRNLTYTTTSIIDDVGLFGDINNAAIKNLGLVDVNLSAGCSYGGGLVGRQNYGSITNCYSTGSVATAATYSYAGGLAGMQYYGTIKGCYSTCSVSSSFNNFYAGGLVGYQYHGTISNCYSKGAVTSSSYSYSGGLVGYQYFAADANIEKCYSTGKVSTTGSDYVYRGGLLGYKSGSSGIVTACFWDTQTSGLGSSAGGAGAQGRITTQMKTGSNFTAAKWDFNDTWAICEAMSYPKFPWQYMPGDIVCPDGVDIEDLAVLCSQWLYYEIPADVAPQGGDGIVDFSDFAVFANQWNAAQNIDDLYNFAEQWLKNGIPVCSADISSNGQVNSEDFALMADNWMQGF